MPGTSSSLVGKFTEVAEESEPVDVGSERRKKSPILGCLRGGKSREVAIICRLCHLLHVMLLKHEVRKVALNRTR